jgi:hypothetical protein
MNTALIITAKKKIIIKILLLTIMYLSFIFLAGCAGSYGHLQRNEEVDKIFKTYRILPGHKYFYTGPAGRPDAIMGVHNEFTLETTQWTQFDPSDDTLKTGVDSINFHNSNRVRNYPYGFLILDSEGIQVGIWYSIWDWTTVIREDDNRIKVFPPAIEEPFGNGEQQENVTID